MRDIVGLLAEPGHTVRSAAAVDTLGAAAPRAGNDRTAIELLERAASRHQLFGTRTHLLYVPDADLDALRELAAAHHSTACEAYLTGRLATPIRAVESAPVLLTPARSRCSARGPGTARETSSPAPSSCLPTR